MTRIALTGTPGTGKTTVADTLTIPHEIVHLGDLIEEVDAAVDHDPVRDSTIVDLDALSTAVADYDDVLFESHLAHHLDVDCVIVLRCHPEVLATRLRRRSIPERSIRENAESEALDLILSEAVDRHGRDAVAELDTTDRPVEAVAESVTALIRGEREPAVGVVDFTDTL